jgi:hypothetical protein
VVYQNLLLTIEKVALWKSKERCLTTVHSSAEALTKASEILQTEIMLSRVTIRYLVFLWLSFGFFLKCFLLLS